MRQKFKQFSLLLSPSNKSYVITALLVLLASLMITFWTWKAAKDNLKADIQTTLNSATTSANLTITDTVADYTEVLKGGAGLFNASNDVTANEWSSYFQSLSFPDRYPGLQAVAYSEAVSNNNIASFLTNTQNEYTNKPIILRPDSVRENYVITRFIEPYNEKTAITIGFDVSSEPTRQKAIIQAMDSGKPAITNRIILIQDKNREPGFLIFVPVYKKGLPINTVGQRRTAILGFVSAGVRSNELIDGLFSSTLTPNSALQVFDGNTTNYAKNIYTSKTYGNLIRQPGISSAKQTITIGKSNWNIVAYVNEKTASSTQQRKPNEILITGLAFSLLVSALLYIFMTNRANAITSEKNLEVQEVKDSLISLASHQLRTPATGVKQFIGMVLEGYVGDINKEQRDMLKKAYISNERQLEIINQILHVTRADSGRLKLDKKNVNVINIIRTVLDEYSQTIKARKQKVVIHAPDNAVFVNGDKQYLTMVFDNLLTNASKYSHRRTQIDIFVRKSEGSAIFTVSDNGVGIKKGDMHLLFQKFSRIHNVLSVEAGGNGIGLYLCKEIVVLHGGRIDVSSQPGKGTNFKITLPLNA